MCNWRFDRQRPREHNDRLRRMMGKRWEGAQRVAKKRGNPNWGKPEVNTVPYAGASSFEEVVKKLRLSPTEYESSIQLKDWVRKNKITNTCHHSAPSMGLEVKGES